MSDKPTLRALPSPDRPAMSRDELQKHGNERVREARDAGVTAMRASMVNHVVPGHSYSWVDLRRLRSQAQEAAAAWQKVDRLLSDLFDDRKHASDAARRGPEPTP